MLKVSHTFLKNIDGRAAQEIASVASKSKDTIYICIGDLTANASSLLNIIRLCITAGDEAIIMVSGSSPESELETLENFIKVI